MDDCAIADVRGGSGGAGDFFCSSLLDDGVGLFETSEERPVVEVEERQD